MKWITLLNKHKTAFNVNPDYACNKELAGVVSHSYSEPRKKLVAWFKVHPVREYRQRTHDMEVELSFSIAASSVVNRLSVCSMCITVHRLR